MQNRYVADIGDYVKFAILRALAPGRTLGLAWWLFPDEDHNADGGHREYLQQEHVWKQYDPILFEALLKINRENTLHVSAIERAAFLPDAVFAAAPVPCEIVPFALRPLRRSTWLAGIKEALKDCNLIFLDPDNGIASNGLKLTQRLAGKSVTIEEINELQEGNRTVVVYHHQTRRKGGHRSEIYDLAARLRDRKLHVAGALRARPWSPRVFFILNGDAELNDRAKALAEHWGPRISWHPESEILRN